MNSFGQHSHPPLSLFAVSPQPNVPWSEIGVDLVQRAEAVARRVFELRAIPAPGLQEKALAEIAEAIEGFSLMPRDDWSVALEVKQGKPAIDKLLAQHGDIALRQAVYVAYCWKTLLMPLAAPRMTAESASVCEALRTMMTALEQANRHMAMLEALRNLEQSHYSVRASQGGYARHASLSKKERERLLRAMVKGMVATDPRLKQGDLTENADTLARRIFDANGQYQFFNIAKVSELQAEVRTYLYEWVTRSQRKRDTRRASQAFLNYRLRHPFPKHPDQQRLQMEKEAAQTQGCLEGQGLMLAVLMEQRFGDLPDSVLEALHEADEATLQAWGLGLEKATCWEELLEKMPA